MIQADIKHVPQRQVRLFRATVFIDTRRAHDRVCGSGAAETNTKG